MTQQKMKKAGAGKASRVISILLFALCAILLIVSVAGYVITRFGDDGGEP